MRKYIKCIEKADVPNCYIISYYYKFFGKEFEYTRCCYRTGNLFDNYIWFDNNKWIGCKMENLVRWATTNNIHYFNGEMECQKKS